MDTRTALEQALAMHRRRLESVRPDQWEHPTPCTDWDVRQLANHVIGEVRWMPPLVAGQTIAEVGDSLSGDLLGNDALESWDDASAQALSSVQARGALQRTVHLSYGDVPASDYVAEVTADIVIHTWDLARATGSDERLDPELVTFATETLEPRLEGWRSAGILGPAVEVGPQADAQTRLLAATGRRA